MPKTAEEVIVRVKRRQNKLADLAKSSMPNVAILANLVREMNKDIELLVVAVSQRPVL